jgi:hypothetical protein
MALRMPGRASAATTCPAGRASDQPVGELSYWVLPEARGRQVAPRRGRRDARPSAPDRRGAVGRPGYRGRRCRVAARRVSAGRRSATARTNRSIVRVSPGRWSCSSSRSIRRALLPSSHCAQWGTAGNDPEYCRRFCLLAESLTLTSRRLSGIDQRRSRPPLTPVPWPSRTRKACGPASRFNALIRLSPSASRLDRHAGSLDTCWRWMQRSSCASSTTRRPS